MALQLPFPAFDVLGMPLHGIRRRGYFTRKWNLKSAVPRKAEVEEGLRRATRAARPGRLRPISLATGKRCCARNKRDQLTISRPFLTLEPDLELRLRLPDGAWARSGPAGSAYKIPRPHNVFRTGNTATAGERK